MKIISVAQQTYEDSVRNMDKDQVILVESDADLGGRSEKMQKCRKLFLEWKKHKQLSEAEA